MNDNTRKDIKSLLQAIDELDSAWVVWNHSSEATKHTKSLVMAKALRAVMGHKTILSIDMDYEPTKFSEVGQ